MSNTPTDYTLFPITIKGMYLDSPKQVSSPLADFSKLPYNNGTQDINSSQPFVSNGVVREPFEDENLILGKGVHLHFIIPHFLGTPIPQNSGLSNAGQLPAAPNRWLISKSSGTLGAVASETWVVESDYIHPSDFQPTQATTIIPYNKKGEKPYRYMGRQTKLSDPRPTGDTFKSLGGKPLTVAGYGDVNFSSFYPNCLGSFGFYDEGGVLGGSDDTYSVLGWNHEEGDDVVWAAMNELIAQNPTITMGELNSKIYSIFNFSDTDGTDITTPGFRFRVMFYGNLKMDAANTNASPPATTASLPDLNIAVGNNGVDALSVFMANQLSTKPTTIATIEEQIEAGLQHHEIDHLLSDHGPKYKEVTHAKGFTAEALGKIWEITEKPNQNQATLGGEGKLPLKLPSSFLSPLTQLNGLQRKYDEASVQIHSLKEQLYADWYKYMHARYTAADSRGNYPDADQVMQFIESNSIPELEGLIAQTGSINWQDSGNTSIPQAAPLHGNTMANQVYEAWNALNNLIEEENVLRVKDKLQALQLSASPGPRYWKAKEPTLLLSGMGTTAKAAAYGNYYLYGIYGTTTRELNVNGLSAAVATTIPVNKVPTQVNVTFIQYKVVGMGTQLFSAQVWNPYLMDWEIDLRNNGLKNSNDTYTSDSFKDNFQLEQFGPDLKHTPDSLNKSSIFSGTVMLSGHATVTLSQQISNFLDGWIKKQGLEFITIPSSNPAKRYKINDFLSQSSWKKAVALLTSKETKDAANIPSATATYTSNPIRSLWKCHQQLSTQNVLSQSLNGFNEACVMRKKVAQLPIAEPLGFGYEQAFTQKVNQLVGRAKDSSPVMAFNFDPIHGGEFSIKRLSIMDNFGVTQSLPVDTAKILPSKSMTNANNQLALPERFSQSARLNFRYLQPNSNEEMNSHPESSPICGWLMADYLNNFIAVYDAKGVAKGYVDASAQWNPTPWAVNVEPMEETLSDDALYKVVEQLCNHENFFQNFMTATQNALDNIAPHNAHLFSTKAILMGKPMAIVRTQLNYEVKGLSSLEQSWSALLSDMKAANFEWMNYANRNDRNWSNIKFPLRIGEHVQLNDGLIGYWVESETGALNGEFMAPQTESTLVNANEVNTFTPSTHQVQWMSLNDAPLRTTMIIDPVGALHATTGILPTKSISIPSEHYLPVLEKLAFWFRTSPLLQTASTENSMPLNLPKISGYQWKWWNKKDGFKALSKEPTTPDIHGNYQLKDGWLLLSPESN